MSARANWVQRTDLPVPAAPVMSVLVPQVIPPPSSVSSDFEPLSSVSLVTSTFGSSCNRRGLVVEQDDRAIAAVEELLESEDLPAKAQWLARQQSHFRQRVERDARRVDSLDRLQYFIDGLLQLDLGRMEDRIAFGHLEARFLGQLEDLDSFEAPAVRIRNRVQ